MNLANKKHMSRVPRRITFIEKTKTILDSINLCHMTPITTVEDYNAIRVKTSSQRFS